MTDIKKIKEDSFIGPFVRNNGVTDEFISENLNMFLRVMRSRELCRDCKGLESCRQSSPGQVLTFDYLGTVVEEIEFCRYARKNIDRDEHAQDYVYCDIPGELLDITLDDVDYTDDQKELYALLLGVLHGKRDRGLYIYGDLGTGKTYLCSALANSLVRKGEKVAFVKVSDFFNDMKASVAANSQLVDRTIRKLKKADYLFLDDIGAETVSQFVRDDILFSILDYRMAHHLVTFFTSNIDKEALYKHYQYDRHEKSNIMKAQRLMERIDILTEDYVLAGRNMRRLQDA